MMTKNISLGQYVPVDSPLHRLDPRTKLAWTLAYVLSLFIMRGIWAVGLAVIFLVVIIRLSAIPPLLYLKAAKPLLILILFTTFMNLFFVPGHTLAAFGPLTVTEEGIRTAAYLVIRLLCLIAGSSVMTFTTTPGKLTDGLEKGLHFLTRIRVPVGDLAMMMGIALRFIPLLSEELDRIIKVQTARGADFDEGNFLVRAKKLIPVLVPLFVASIRRASDIALAMDARCYRGGEGRTRLHPLGYEKRDYIAWLIMPVYLAAVIVCRIAAGKGGLL